MPTDSEWKFWEEVFKPRVIKTEYTSPTGNPRTHWAFFGDVGDWWRWHSTEVVVGVAGALLVVGVIAAMLFAVNEDAKRREAWMAECRADRKNYECEAMWRAGENHTTVIPMPVVVSR